jgi:NTE family protein
MINSEDTPLATRAPKESLALMLGGGGARGAYQAGVLRAIARRYPSLRLPILTGISAGAMNTTFLAAQAAPLPKRPNNWCVSGSA